MCVTWEDIHIPLGSQVFYNSENNSYENGTFIYFLNKKFYWRKIEPPCTQGKEHNNSTETELKVTTTQCCLRLLFNFLNGFHQFFK